MQVFVLSVRAAAVGITLTSANHVFFLEPLLNIALGDQAVGRAWRMGQKREVTVKRLFVNGSVEEAIIAVAKKRQQRGEGGASSGAKKKQTQVRRPDPWIGNRVCVSAGADALKIDRGLLNCSMHWSMISHLFWRTQESSGLFFAGLLVQIWVRAGVMCKVDSRLLHRLRVMGCSTKRRGSGQADTSRN